MTTSANSTQQKIVLRLLDVISAKLPMPEARTLLHTKVRAYVDGTKIATGQNAWKKWVLFLQHTAHQRGIKNLRIVTESIHNNGAQVVVQARWHGTINGKESTSDIGCVTYHVQNNKIIAVQTHKANYTFIYGTKVTNPLFFYLLLLRVMFFRTAS